MYELPFNAKVTCTDGHCGTSVAFTLHPLTRIVSNLVVEDDQGHQRLVSLNTVNKTSDDEIWLSCTEDELREMELFQTIIHLLWTKVPFLRYFRWVIEIFRGWQFIPKQVSFGLLNTVRWEEMN